MIIRSARFDKVIVRSHEMRARVDVLRNGEAVATNLNLVGGAIEFDRTAQVRAHGQLTLAEPDRRPDANFETILRPGYDLRISVGIVYQDGTEELLQRGVFPIREAAFAGSAGTVEVTFTDRAGKIARARLEQAYVVTAGVDYGTHIQRLLSAAYPGLTFAFATVTYAGATDLPIPAQSDPWEQATNLARDAGCELFIDAYDRVVLRYETPGAGDPVWSFTEGTDGTLLDAAVVLTDDGVYNRTIATGANPDTTGAAVPRGVFTDDKGWTAYGSSFGPSPRFYASPFILTDDQARSAAQAIQSADDNAGVRTTFDAVAHYALELGDLVQVTHAALGIDDVFQVEQFRLGLTPEDTAIGMAA